MVQTAKQHRQQLTPDAEKAWSEFSKTVFAPGVLDAKTKQLIAIAVAHVTQCPFCIRAHAPAAKHAGVTEAEMMEAIWVAAEMRAGGAVAHSHLAFEAYTRDNKSG